MPHAKKILAILISSAAFSACMDDVDVTPDETVAPAPVDPVDPVDETPVLKQIDLEVDTNADGTPDYIETYTYDANGNLLSESYDDNGDGTPDYIYTFTNTYY